MVTVHLKDIVVDGLGCLWLAKDYHALVFEDIEFEDLEHDVGVSCLSCKKHGHLLSFMLVASCLCLDQSLLDDLDLLGYLQYVFRDQVGHPLVKA